MPQHKYEFGLVLSGGGARGIVHIGVLKELEEHDLVPPVIVGASMGALIGVLHGAGHNADQLMSILKSINFRGLYRYISLRGGLLSMNYIRALLHRYIGNDNFYSVKRKTYVVTSNLNKGTFDVFSTGPLYDVVLASTSIPLIFKPVRINGQTYIDGGLYNNLPADVIRDDCRFLVGVHANYNGELDSIRSNRAVLDRVFSQAIYNNVRSREALCDVLISPDILRHYSLFNFDRADELFEIGRREAAKYIPEIKRQLDGKKPFKRFIENLFND